MSAPPPPALHVAYAHWRVFSCKRGVDVWLGMHLQVMGLQGLVQAYSLTSLSTKEETAAVMNTLTAAASKPKKAGKGGSAAAAAAAAAGDPAAQQPMLLYCTPEKIVASKRLMSKLEKLYQVGAVQAGVLVVVHRLKQYPSCALCSS